MRRMTRPGIEVATESGEVGAAVETDTWGIAGIGAEVGNLALTVRGKAETGRKTAVVTQGSTIATVAPSTGTETDHGKGRGRER